VGISGTLTGARVYASSVDSRGLDEVTALDSPNLGVCLKARLDRIGDVERKLSAARSSVAVWVKCVYTGCNATNMDQSRANTWRSPAV
jgi:hypothetical protein